MIDNDNVTLKDIKIPSSIPRFQTLWAALVFTCLSVYALGANPFSAQTIGPLDLIMVCPGWSTVQAPQKIVHFESTDIVDSQLPTWISLKAQIREGKGALWWPYGTGGQPVTLELLNPVFLLFLAVRDNALAYYLVGWLKLFIAGMGGYLLLRVFLRWLPSIWGGMVFMLCGFNAAWFFWEQVATAMWIPWLLWATVMYLKTEENKWLPAITATSLLLIIGGFPAVAAFGFYSFGLLVFYWNIQELFLAGVRTAVKDDGKMKPFLVKTSLPFLAVSIGFLLSAVTIVPFADSMSGVSLAYRTGGGTPFGVQDLPLFLHYETPLRIERTAYIGIPAFLFALIGVLSAFREKDDKLRRFIGFLLLLVVVGILITFGILPHRFIRAIPVFNSNNWGRLIVIPLLGLAALSATGINYSVGRLPESLSRHLNSAPVHAYRILTLFVVMITILQFHAQKKLFNSFNAVVPSSWFYPITPSIKYAKENLKPLQSVIADSAFSMSGTLGAYGIAQWYAHTFRSDKEIEVLKSLIYEPFPSPTSALIEFNNITLDSPLMEKLAVKYLLAHKSAVESEIFHEVPSTSRFYAPPPGNNVWRQHIQLPKDMGIGGIGLFLATYGEEYAPANVRLAMYRDGDENVLAESVMDRKRITDNAGVFFKFPRRVYLKKDGYTMTVSLVGYAGPKKLAALVAPNSGDTGNYLEIYGKKSNISLQFGIAEYVKKDLSRISDRWNVIDLESDVVLFENKRVTNSAYFVKDLDARNDRLEYSGISVRQPSSGVIEIEYSGGTAGWIVLPMHLHHGWKAYIGNQQIRYDDYLGIMPAIPVQGASRVMFRYEPRSFRTGVLLSSIGMILFIAFSIKCMKKGH